LPDAEKLSWLVVGRANADGSAQMAMLQQAAMAMVSRNGDSLTSGLANSLGLDEISMGGLGTNADSTGGTGATVKIGKRLAGNFYLAYERSIAGAYGTFYIFYDLSKHLTLRGQAGEQSAMDLIFTTRYD
jgi:translocation and assembly module TamB